MQFAPLAPEVPRRNAGTDYVRPARRVGYRGSAGRPLVGDVGRNAPKRHLDSRQSRRACDLIGRPCPGSTPFARWHTRVLSAGARLVVIGKRLGGSVSRTALHRPRFREERPSADGCLSHRLRYLARREGSGFHDNRQQRRFADFAGVPGPARTTAPDRSIRGSGILRR